MRHEAAEISPDEELMSVLTAKEIEVIELLARGLNNKEMAAELFVTESTIKARFVKIMENLFFPACFSYNAVEVIS